MTSASSAHAPDAATSQPLSSTYECVICFDGFEHVAVLPCACNVAYCTRCWDRALAQSLNSTGEARCPTCRSPVDVNFDADKGCLVFSSQSQKDEDDTQRSKKAKQSRKEMRKQFLDRLYEQARPAQAQTLKQFGESENNGKLKALVEAPTEWLQARPVSELKEHVAAMGGDTRDCLEKADLVRCLQDIAGSTHALVSQFAAASQSVPKCVCGSSLQRLTGADRAIRALERHCPGIAPGSAQFQMVFNSLTANGDAGIVCDLCDTHCALKDMVWTCENGNDTILHANAYDVCDLCFVRHVGGMDLPLASSEGISDQEELPDVD